MKYITILLTVLGFFSITMSAQEKSDTTKTVHKVMSKDHQKMNLHEKDSIKHMMHEMQDVKKLDSADMQHMDHGKMHMDNANMKKSPLVHDGIIDLHAIDKNKDGKVFQDPMDWNVISDSSGECPLCGMYLKEYTIEKAKSNLKKHGYKVQEDMQK
jgi:Cu(I)/Ag(I) efflux system membrane fusion protein/cobalt-zinc-cadmium efflux system membrane fusion protein